MNRIIKLIKCGTLSLACISLPVLAQQSSSASASSINSVSASSISSTYSSSSMSSTDYSSTTKCEITSVQTWGDTFQIAGEITNIGALETTQWRELIRVTKGYTLGQSWGGSVERVSPTTFAVNNSEWNGRLGGGESVTFGVQGTFTGTFIAPQCFDSIVASSSSSTSSYVDYKAMLNVFYTIEGNTVHFDASQSRYLTALDVDFGDMSEGLAFESLGINQKPYDELVFSHAYDNPGSYAVRFHGYSYPWGSVDYYNLTVGPENEPPVADFACEEYESTYYSGGEEVLSVSTQCNSLSTDPNGDTLKLQWDIGTDANPEWMIDTYAFGYEKPGIYPISLKVTDGEYTDTKTIEWKARSRTGEEYQGENAEKPALSCEYTLLSEWNSGFSGKVLLTNTGESPVDGWTLGIQFPGDAQITVPWSTILTGENPYTASNLGYNATIMPGQTVSFGFVGSKGSAEIQSPIITGDLCQ